VDPYEKAGLMPESGVPLTLLRKFYLIGWLVIELVRRFWAGIVLVLI